MKIVHAASELYPYMKTGGLADAVASLTVALVDRGHEVAVFLPGYRSVVDDPDAAEAVTVLRPKIEMGDVFMSGEIKTFSPRVGLTVYLVCRDEFFDRRNAYGTGERDYEDNHHRFIFFCKGVVETMRLLRMNADVIHCHDWQTGLLPLLSCVTRNNGTATCWRCGPFLRFTTSPFRACFRCGLFTAPTCPMS